MMNTGARSTVAVSAAGSAGYARGRMRAFSKWGAERRRAARARGAREVDTNRDLMAIYTLTKRSLHIDIEY